MFDRQDPNTISEDDAPRTGQIHAPPSPMVIYTTPDLRPRKPQQPAATLSRTPKRPPRPDGRVRLRRPARVRPHRSLAGRAYAAAIRASIAHWDPTGRTDWPFPPTSHRCQPHDHPQCRASRRRRRRPQSAARPARRRPGQPSRRWRRSRSARSRSTATSRPSVGGYLSHVVERRLVSRPTSGINWCPRWWAAHPEAISRLYALWRAWETLRVTTPGPA